MAKRKVNIRGKSRKPKRKPWWSQLFHFIVLPPVWRITLLFLILALLFWQWSLLTSWASNIVEGALRLFGWGLLLIVIAIGTLAGVLWRRKLSSLIHHWNQWLGGIALALAVWGILAFFPGEGILKQVSLGGSFGLGIIFYQDSELIGIIPMLASAL